MFSIFTFFPIVSRLDFFPITRIHFFEFFFITKKEEKFNAVWNAMLDKNDVNEFKEKFKEMYPSDWGS